METIIRVVKDHDADPFARIDKIPINDDKLSWKAKGILCYAMSKPDGWKFNITDLVNHAVDGEKAVRSGLAELMNNKYCSRVRLINSKTKRVIRWIYVFYERPYPGEIMKINDVLVDPLPQNGKVDPDPLPQNLQVENLQVGKGGGINNNVNNKEVSLNIKGINSSINKEDPEKIIAAAALPKKYLREFRKIKKQIINMGWGGSWDDVVKTFINNPQLVTAWVNHINSKSGLHNPAGLLRHGLRSGKMPVDREKTERKKYQDDPYAEFIEP